MPTVSPAPKKRGGQLRTTSDFIERATKVHSDRYAYDRVAYTGSGGLVEIGCRVHGLSTAELVGRSR